MRRPSVDLGRLFFAVLLLPSLTAAAEAASTPSPPPTPAHRRYGDWTSSQLGGGGYLQHFVFAPSARERVYLATDVGGVYRSDDEARTWRMLHGALPPGEGSTQIRGLAVHPRDADRLLLAAGNPWDERGIYRSDDGGASFRLTYRAPFHGNHGTRGWGAVLVNHPTQPDTVFAGVPGRGLCRSDDFGAHWTALGPAATYPAALWIDRANPARLWLVSAPGKVRLDDQREAKSEHGLWLSRDGGVRWTRVYDNPSGHPGFIEELVQDPRDPERLYATFGKGQVRTSTDEGATWTPFDGVFPPAVDDPRADGRYAALATGPDFVLAAGHGANFYRLDRFADGWRRLPPASAANVREGDWYARLDQPIERHCGAALGFAAVSPRDPAVWAFTDWYAFYLSQDAGASWDLRIDGIEMAVVHAVAQDPARPDRVHAGMADIGYFRSDDGAAHFNYWGRFHGIGNNIRHLAVSPSRPERIYAVGPREWHWWCNQIFRSDDGGGQWTRPAMRGLPELANREGGRRVNTVAVDPARPDRLYAAISHAVVPQGGEGGVYRSDDAGESWVWMGGGLDAGPLFRADIWAHGPELAASADGSLVAVSRDHGKAYRFDAATKRWTRLACGGGNAVVADPLTQGRYYLALWTGLYRSDDGGLHWTNLFDASVRYVAVDAATPGRVALWAENRFHISDDAGLTWRALPDGLPFRADRNVCAFAGERLVVGTGGSGLFHIALRHAETAPPHARNNPAKDFSSTVTDGTKP